MTGVIDRFEGEYAVIALDNKEIIKVERDKIPVSAKEGDVLCLGEKILIDQEETSRRRKECRKYLELWED